ncbi:class I SAM-dependent methyltransferase [Kocuria sp.]|uniref:class I SAM-dependent methyltransferase n=1 Tax=Kocuria sp. TaxID=1871328 RepID=UPI0026DEE33C|nr:class I SAM-dependent methyltransferase [Kocuria sp.]MDO5618618.1 class I SAM-dependent methyltransferase [Kocuria sp.]
MESTGNSGPTQQPLAPQGAPADRLITLWESVVERDPTHSNRYIERFQKMREAGADLHGEARFVDAMLPRESRILDAGCGPGRIGGELIRRGHHVVGVDVDPVLITAATQDHPDGMWLHGDLAHLEVLDLVHAHADADDTEGFKAIVCAGNVMTFLAAGTHRAVLEGFRRHLSPDGRAVVGFGTTRGYDPQQFFDDAESAGFSSVQRFATWEMHPYRRDSDFLVAILNP